MSYASTTYALGADRSAAIGLPALLLPEFGHLALDRSEIEEAMRWCTTSLFDEVRAAFSVAVQPVWDTPCDLQTDSIACRHQTAWAAVQEGLRDCRMGGWDQTAQRRLPDPLEGPYEHTLPTVPTDSLLVNRLVAPLVAAAAAAQSSSCIAEEAKRLLKVLFEAHRRGADHWAREGYGGYNDRQRGAVARVLIEATQAGDAQPLSQYIQLFTSNARALQELLRDLALLFTYDDPLRPSLPEVWRTVMSVALDAIDAGAELLGDHHWSDYAIGGLLPTPQLDTGDADPDATLARARQAWVAPDAIADLVTRVTRRFR